MNKMLLLTTLTLLLVFSTTLSFAETGRQFTVQGEVIEVQQQTQTPTAIEDDQLWVRTRQGREVRLATGRAGGCPDCVQVGDQIRARVRGGSEGQASQVQSMKVRRDGSMYSYRFQNGELAQSQFRQRARDGSGVGGNDRQQWRRGEGNGGCRGNCGRSRGSGAGAGGQGNSRGGGGG